MRTERIAESVVTLWLAGARHCIGINQMANPTWQHRLKSRVLAGPAQTSGVAIAGGAIRFSPLARKNSSIFKRITVRAEAWAVARFSLVRIHQLEMDRDTPGIDDEARLVSFPGGKTSRNDRLPPKAVCGRLILARA